MHALKEVATTTVDFHDQLARCAIEIRDEVADRALPSNL